VPPEDRFETTRCLLLSLAVGSIIAVDRPIDLVDEKVDQIHLGGGGVRNEFSA
jgi:sugar (pentulose or hexulose) kinase